MWTSWQAREVRNENTSATTFSISISGGRVLSSSLSHTIKYTNCQVDNRVEEGGGGLAWVRALPPSSSGIGCLAAAAAAPGLRNRKPRDKRCQLPISANLTMAGNRKPCLDPQDDHFRPKFEEIDDQGSSFPEAQWRSRLRSALEGSWGSDLGSPHGS